MSFPIIRFVLLLPALLTVGLLAAQEKGKRFVPALVGFYNVENLFDTIDTPGLRDQEYTPDSPKQWNTQRYHRKLERLAQVLGDMGKDLHPDGLAVIGLAEVENKEVVEDLAATPPIDKRGYRVVHEPGPDRRGVDVALMYDPRRFTYLSHKSYRLTVPDKPDFRTRDQLLVSGVLDGDTMHVIVAHWPSRRGGEKRSMPMRMKAAELGRHIIDSLLAGDPLARVIYMGDLNDDPTSPSVRRGLRAVGQRDKVTADKLYGPMEEPYRKGIGTLAWRDAWNLFDQIILTHSLVTGEGGRYRYYGVRIFNEPYLRQRDGNFAGYPFRTYVGDTYKDGYSDHFPVYVILVKEVEDDP